MDTKNIRLGIIAAAVYGAAVAGALAVIAWLRSTMGTGGIDRFLNAGYAAGLGIGMVITFVCGYLYHPILDISIARYTNENPDMPPLFAEALCRTRLLSRYFICAAIACFASAAALFALTGENDVEAICLLLGGGFISAFFSIHFGSQPREIMRRRFRRGPV